MSRLKTLTFSTLVAVLALTGCAKEPTQGNGATRPDQAEYLDFATTTKVAIDVDYGTMGAQALIGLYTEIPYTFNEDGSATLKPIKPLFATFSDKNGKFSGNLSLPDAVEKVYLHTYSIGLPQCVEVAVKGKQIKFNLSELASESPARSTQKIMVESPTNDYPYLLDNSKLLYSTCQWGSYGKPVANPHYDIIDAAQTVTTEWINKLKKALGYTGSSKKDNSKYVVSEEFTNIAIAKRAENENGEIVNVIDAKIMLTFIDETAWYQNTFGYYYYPTDQKPSSVNELKKYVVFPNTSTAGHVPFMSGSSFEAKYAPLKPASQVTLKFIDDAGVSHDRFPSGYTIGWFVISDAFESNSNLAQNKLNTDNKFIYSNGSFNDDKKSKCITLNDKDTGRMVIGFEDGPDNSYDDFLFFVHADPSFAIQDPNKPTIDGDGDITIPDGEQKSEGTFAFEDRWPSKGDYDMNDVIVEYTRVITFDKDNMVKKIEDTFTPTHDMNSAYFINAFAYQVGEGQSGTFQLSNGVEFEAATNSFIVFKHSKDALGKTYSIVREFSASNTFNKATFKEYNPFIINAYTGEIPRSEVHLPKHPATAYANKMLVNTNDDAYYVDADGKYPFAIYAPVLGFKPTVEGKKIGSKGQYEEFNFWVESGLQEYKDWYLHK